MISAIKGIEEGGGLGEEGGGGHGRHGQTAALAAVGEKNGSGWR